MSFCILAWIYCQSHFGPSTGVPLKPPKTLSSQKRLKTAEIASVLIPLCLSKPHGVWIQNNQFTSGSASNIIHWGMLCKHPKKWG